MTSNPDPPRTLARGVPGALARMDRARLAAEAALTELVEAQRCVEDNPRTAPVELVNAVAESRADLVAVVTRLGGAAARVKTGEGRA